MARSGAYFCHASVKAPLNDAVWCRGCRPNARSGAGFDARKVPLVTAIHADEPQNDGDCDHFGAELDHGNGDSGIEGGKEPVEELEENSRAEVGDARERKRDEGCEDSRKNGLSRASVGPSHQPEEKDDDYGEDFYSGVTRSSQSDAMRSGCPLQAEAGFGAFYQLVILSSFPPSTSLSGPLLHTRIDSVISDDELPLSHAGVAMRPLLSPSRAISKYSPQVS